MGSTSRQSNMELLRLVAMFLIMLLHANNTIFNYLTSDVVTSRPLYVLPFLTIESFANVGVNLFVLISGWFGIRARLRGFANILFQPIYYALLFIGVFMLIGAGNPLHPKSLANIGLFTKYYWYIKAYLGLYILSPVLNSFIQDASKKQIEVVLLFFFIFQTLYGCTDSAPDFYLGYSIISFIGLYLTGHYIHKYADKLKSHSVSTYLSVYLLCTIVLTLLVFISFKIDPSGFIKRGLYAYCNPIVIIQSISLVLLFNRFSFQSKAINWAAASCLAVYLIHENINLQWSFRKTAHDIYTNSGFLLSFLELLLYLAAVFFISILVDQIRILIWERIEKHIPEIKYSEL